MLHENFIIWFSRAMRLVKSSRQSDTINVTRFLYQICLRD